MKATSKGFTSPAFTAAALRTSLGVVTVTPSIPEIVTETFSPAEAKRRFNFALFSKTCDSSVVGAPGLTVSFFRGTFVVSFGVEQEKINSVQRMRFFMGS